MAEILEGDVRCWYCGRTLIYSARIERGSIDCPKCRRWTKIPRPQKPAVIAAGHGVEVSSSL